MANKLELARKVFSIFQAEYERNAHRTGVYTWSLDLRGDDASRVDELGLSAADVGVGLGLLAHKGLLLARTATSYLLTPDGKEVCVHPELLDECLAPRRPASASQQVTIHGGHVQIGDANSQSITYQTFLTSLATAVETNPDVPAEKRAAWAVTLRELAVHPLTQTLISAAAGAANGGG